jgi:hypothetical protein
MNDVVVQAHVAIPLVHRNWVAAGSTQIRGGRAERLGLGLLALALLAPGGAGLILLGP